MASKKIYDLMVKTGEYQTSSGEKKGRWLSVGRVMQTDDGREFIMLDRTFNPAGVPDLTGKGGDAVLISKFEPRNNDQGGWSAPSRQSARTAQEDGAAPSSPASNKAPGFEDLDQDIPF